MPDQPDRPPATSSSGIGGHLDPEAWVDRHADALYGYAIQRLRDPQVAEDLVQETFLAALGSARKFRQDASERTWLTSILKHKLIDHLRKQYRQRSVEAGLTDTGWDSQFDSRGGWKKVPADWRPNPDQLLEQGDFWRVLDDCLGKLPTQMAQAFTLRVMDQMSGEEVRKVLSVTATNLWVILHRARGKLRRCLEVNWFDRPSEGSE